MTFIQRFYRNAALRSFSVSSAFRSNFCQQASFRTSCIRSTAPAKPARPARPSSTLRALASRVPPKTLPANLAPSAKALTIQQGRAAHHATKLYEAGTTELYRAPSHFAYLTGSWVLGLSCIGSSCFLVFSGWWQNDPDSGLPWFVPIAYRLSMFCLTVLGGWVLLRSTRTITAIDLLSRGGLIKMAVRVRRPIPVPFVKPRYFEIQPYELQLPTRVVAPLIRPEWLSPSEAASNVSRMFSSIPRMISRAFFNFFAGTRKIFTQEGFLIVSLAGGDGYKLDIDGKVTSGWQNLVEASTQES